MVFDFILLFQLAVAYARMPQWASVTRGDPLRYFNCQLKGRRRLESRNARLSPGARTFDKRCELTFERFFAFDRDFVTRNPPPNAPIDLAGLILRIQREIRVLLENPDLAHELGTDAARGNLRHATLI